MIIVLTGSDIFSGDNRFDNSTDWGETFSVVIIGVIIVLTGGGEDFVLITGVIIVLTGGHVFCGDNRCESRCDNGETFSVVKIGVIIVLTGRDVFCGDNRCDNSSDWDRRFLWLY